MAQSDSRQPHVPLTTAKNTGKNLKILNSKPKNWSHILLLTLGRYFCFCSSVPYSSIPLNPMDW